MATMVLFVVATNIPFSTKIACEMMQIKHEMVVSRAWMHRFMLGRGLSHKVTNANANDKNFTMQEAQAAQHFLACKTLWLQ
eukprot:3060601-Amphidinium_carterae.1